MLKDPKKFSTWYLKFLVKNVKSDYWVLANAKRNIGMKFGKPTHNHALAADGFTVGGHMAPSLLDKIGLSCYLTSKNDLEL